MSDKTIEPITLDTQAQASLWSAVYASTIALGRPTREATKRADEAVRQMNGRMPLILTKHEAEELHKRISELAYAIEKLQAQAGKT